MAGDPAEARELLRAAARDFGLTQGDIARLTNMTPRYQRLVHEGKRPGTAYLPALRELYARGRVSAPPAPRVQRVRVPGGGVSAEPRRAPERAPARHGTYGRTDSVIAGGAGRSTAVTMPKTPGPQRGRAAAELSAEIDRAARAGQTVTLDVTLRLASGEEVTVRRGGAGHTQTAKSLRQAVTTEARRLGLDARTKEGRAGALLAAIGAMFNRKSAGQSGANIIGVVITTAPRQARS